MVRQYLFLSLICFSISGCFEIIEEVSYKGKDNGTFSITMNCSKSKTRLKTLLKLDTFMGAKIPKEYEIRAHISMAAEAIRATPGITAVHETVDMDNYIASITFDFDRTESLNKALNNAAQKVDKHRDLRFTDVFSFNNNIFLRHEVPGDSTHNKKIKPEFLGLIPDAYITSIYRFGSEIKNSSNHKALISKSKKAVMLKQKISDVITQPACFTNTITF